ncbi:Chondroitin sulfate synthase 1 [Podila verticillata]|nr:Chondroitin sulfate synthase 1 [Podila verticillata]
MHRTLKIAFVVLSMFLLLSLTFTDTSNLDLVWKRDKLFEVKFYSPSESTARRMTQHNREKKLRNYPSGMTRLEDVIAAKHPKRMLICVLVTASMVESRGKAVMDTWVDYANNKHPDLGIHVVFAYDGKSPKVLQGVPTFPVKPTGYNDVYKKVYESLETVWELYGQDYDYFMKADDDVFIHIDRVAAVFGNTESFNPNLLAVYGYRDPNDFMCWGGPGYILSRQALKEIYPHLQQCGEDFVDGEDISISWCFMRYVFNIHHKPWNGCQAVAYNGTMAAFANVPLDRTANWALWDKPDVEFEITDTRIFNWKYRNMLSLHAFKSETGREPTMQQYYNFYYNTK